jgi:hypothetical protein
MKTKAIKILGMILLLSMAIPAVYARGPTGKAGKSNVAHLYLVEKNPLNWDEIIEDGAWGKLKYNSTGSTFDFVFNGHGLEPETDYNLIYYADPWPGDNPGSLIDSGTSNKGGNLHLMGSVELNLDLPDPADDNYPPGVDGTPDTGDEGAKIWLVPSSDYDGTQMTAWNPTEYLFEYDLITYDDIDV